MRKRQYFTPVQYHKRLKRADVFLGELKTAERESIFSDEKLFTTEAIVIKQNEKV